MEEFATWLEEKKYHQPPMNTEKQLLASQSIEILTSRLMENKISSVVIAYQMTDGTYSTTWYHEGTFLSLIGMLEDVKFDIFHGRAEHE